MSDDRRGGEAAGGKGGPLEAAAGGPRGARSPWNGFGGWWPNAMPLDLRLVGRTLLHAVLAGLLAGAIGAPFVAGLEAAQRLLLEGWAGYVALRAAGGGGDAIIESYHHGGLVRRRVILVKALAAFFTLGSGGSGGREGPTMRIGGAIGALVGRWLPATPRERRILLVAGIAAGMAAVFRTPLGAALLATEMLYRDDVEPDALVPAILASVVASSVVISIFGETTLFGHPARFPFVASHLPLYALLASVLSGCVVPFLKTPSRERRGCRADGGWWCSSACSGS